MNLVLLAVIAITHAKEEYRSAYSPDSYDGIYLQFNISKYLRHFRYIRNQECREQITRFIEELDGGATWASKMFAASSRYPFGILHGNNYQFGDYDTCLSTHSPDGLILGKYCLIDIQIRPDKKRHPSFYLPQGNKEFSLDYNPYDSYTQKFRITRDSSKKRRDIIYNGICVPKICSPVDIQTGLKWFIEEIEGEYGYNISIRFRRNSCSVPDTKKYDLGWKIIWAIIIISSKLVVLSTVWDCLKSEKPQNSTFVVVAESFSLKKNFIRLTSNSNNDFDAFHGMKTLSMMLIILGHRCMASFGGPVFNADFIEKGYRHFPTIFLLSGILIVDTFFLISGFLNFIAIHKEYRKGKNVSIFHVLLLRWMRITPSYMFMVFFYGYVLENLGNGPVWGLKLGWEAERCRQNWWTNFLFINNYVNTNQMCMFQSWYIACDMHYIIMSPVIVKLVSKLGKKGLLLLASGIVASSTSVSAITLYYKYDGILKIYYGTFEDLASNPFFTQMYIKTLNRITPYLSGMAAGYIYLSLKEANTKFSKVTKWCCSFLCLIFGISSICAAWIFYIPGREYNIIENAIYASLHRVFWSVSMGWVAVGCALKTFGRIQPLLTAKVFVPFSKLCFGVFLVHGSIQMYWTASSRVAEYMSYPKLFWMASGDIILSFLFSLMLYLLVEAPMKGIQFFILLYFIPKQNKEIEQRK